MSTRENWSIDDYQAATAEFVAYPPEVEDQYLMAGLLAEVGELLGFYAKVWRGDSFGQRDSIVGRLPLECGDILWFMMRILAIHDIKMSEINRRASPFGYNSDGDTFYKLMSLMRAAQQFADAHYDYVQKKAVFEVWKPYGLKWLAGNIAFLLEELNALNGHGIDELATINYRMLLMRREEGAIKGSGHSIEERLESERGAYPEEPNNGGD